MPIIKFDTQDSIITSMTKEIAQATYISCMRKWKQNPNKSDLNLMSFDDFVDGIFKYRKHLISKEREQAQSHSQQQRNFDTTSSNTETHPCLTNKEPSEDAAPDKDIPNEPDGAPKIDIDDEPDTQGVTRILTTLPKRIINLNLQTLVAMLKWKTLKMEHIPMSPQVHNRPKLRIKLYSRRIILMPQKLPPLISQNFNQHMLIGIPLTKMLKPQLFQILILITKSEK